MNVTNTLLRMSSGEGSPRPLYPAQKLRPQRLAAEAGCWEWVLPGKVTHGASSPFSPSSTHDAQAGFAYQSLVCTKVETRFSKHFCVVGRGGAVDAHAPRREVRLDGGPSLPCTLPRESKGNDTLSALGPPHARLMPPPASGAGLPGTWLSRGTSGLCARMRGLTVCLCGALSAAQDPQAGEALGRHCRSVRSLWLRPERGFLSGRGRSSCGQQDPC